MPPNTDLATRAAVVALKSPACGKTTAEVAQITGLSIRQVNRIFARAIKRGFEPNDRILVLRDEHLQDAARSGRPPKEMNETKAEVTAKEDEAGEDAWVDEEEEKAGC
ncbi:hypothetical protein BGZ63DRAFT_427544 [Mariannaea sp. PMI_226]|nr:hypothetical protein BGZ63DRAFT_427544 [Mariannaea sp. PMI_226]